MIQKATFGGGCFWGVEAAFRRVDGVVETAVGYSGGTTENPTYEDVCRRETGHAEVVQVTFDSSKIGYDQLLTLFWQIHDPTTVNQQGLDIGSQYRSVIFFHSTEQESAAQAAKQALQASGRFRGAIVTEIVAAEPFYMAEDYHQQYLEKRGSPRSGFARRFL